MHRHDFLPAEQHKFTQAKVNGEWYPIKCFHKLSGKWYVNLWGFHPEDNVYEVSKIESWEYCNF